MIITNLNKLRDRVSTSSDDMLNTSDESDPELNASLIAGRSKFVEDGHRPHSLRDEQPRDAATKEVDERWDQLLREAEFRRYLQTKSIWQLGRTSTHLPSQRQNSGNMLI